MEHRLNTESPRIEMNAEVADRKIRTETFKAKGFFCPIFSVSSLRTARRSPRFKLFCSVLAAPGCVQSVAKNLAVAAQHPKSGGHGTRTRNRFPGTTFPVFRGVFVALRLPCGYAFFTGIFQGDPLVFCRARRSVW